MSEDQYKDNLLNLEQKISNINKVTPIEITTQHNEESLLNNLARAQENNYFSSNRHYVSATKEWNNSVYLYNKNNIKTIPVAADRVNDLIQSYFSLNPLLTRKRSNRTQIRERRLSLNRILASKAEMKHTNDKVTVTVYLYNKSKKVFLYKLKDLYKTFHLKKLHILVQKISKVAKSKVSGFAVKSKKNNNQKTLNAVNSVNSKFNTNIKTNKTTSLIDTVENKKKLSSSSSSSSSSGSSVKKITFKDLTQNYIDEVYQGKKSKEKLQNARIYAKLRLSNILKKEYETKRSAKLNKERKIMKRNKKINSLLSVKINNYIYYARITKNRINIFLSNMASFLEKRTSLQNSKNSNSFPIHNLNTMDLTYKYITMLKKNNFSLLALNKYKLFTENTNTSVFNVENNNIYMELNNEDNSYINYAEFNNNLYTSNTYDNILVQGNDYLSKPNNEDVKFPYLSLFFKGAAAKLKIARLKKKSHTKLDSLAKQSLKRSKGLLTKFKTFYKLFVLTQKNLNYSLISTSLSQDTRESDNMANITLHDVSPVSDTVSRISKKIVIKSSALRLKDHVKKIKSKKKILLDPKRKIKTISLKSVKLLKKVRKYKNLLLKILNWKNKAFVNYENKYYKNFMKKAYKKELLYLYYVKLLSFNSIKFKNWFLLGLKKLLNKIYKKKIEFNFVNLKYLHLNSDILSQSIVLKLKNKNNKMLAVLNKALNMIKLAKINKRVFYNNIDNNNLAAEKNNFFMPLNQIGNTNSDGKHYDGLNIILSDLLPNYSEIESNNTGNKSLYLTRAQAVKHNFIQSRGKNILNKTELNVLDSLRYKAVFGVRLEAAGRLSKRITASRSVFKLRYKGNLKNLDSSFHGLSTLTLRGNTKPNLQYTKISSKTRNGSFGLKGWVNSY